MLVLRDTNLYPFIRVISLHNILETKRKYYISVHDRRTKDFIIYEMRHFIWKRKNWQAIIEDYHLFCFIAFQLLEFRK